MITRACFYASVCSVVFASCKDTDEFLTQRSEGQPEVKAPEIFNFSTEQQVDLKVDYSAYSAYGAVRFLVYNTNPIINEGKEVELLDETVDPLYVGYTDRNGKFDATVTLPAYAKVLHIVTTDFTIGLRRMVVAVENSEAKATLPANYGNEYTRASRRVAGKTGPGPATDDMEQFYNLSYQINTSSGAKTNNQVYKEWKTYLGTWDSYSGRPNYRLDPTKATSGLIIADDNIVSLYENVKNALNSGTTCKETYRQATDLTLIKESEVSITVLGSMTCWTNTMGYYYYNDKPEHGQPANPMDLDVIMLFPNTQDGLRYVSNADNAANQGNVGTVRGDVVQLMYYPNIANNDRTGATTKFPKGTKIGFLLKAHGWGTQVSDGSYSIKNGNSICNKKMNIWGASTEGLSFVINNGYKLPNLTGEARTAKFDYLSPEGDRYVITSFEDACDDKDYDDLVFALTPANAFATNAEVEAGKNSYSSVWAYEDMWPNRGDYDMNDVVVNVRNEQTFNDKGNITKQVFYMTTYQKNVDVVNGLAARLNTVTQPSTITMKKMAPGVTDINQATAANFEKYRDSNTGKDVYYLTNKVEDDLGSTYILELTYKTAQASSNVADVEPFIYRPDENGLQWEVHIPMTKPTSKVNPVYFGTVDDKSVPSSNIYYVREGLYPFAFHLTGTKAENFFDTILGKDAENLPIDVFYPTFQEWSTSKGKNSTDWYLNPRNSK